MGRQAFFAVWCMLVFSETLCDSTSVQSVAIDNESAESAPRLYRNVPVGVYASATPYGSYSISIPFISTPKASASRLVPIKEVYQNSYVKDSYGNRFVGSPQSLAYKTAFPPQFVQLQDLPPHLSQPIVAASPSYQYRQPTPFGSSHYTLPLHQSSSPSFGSSQPYVYGGNVKYFASNTPAAAQTPKQATVQQQSTSQKATYAQGHDQYHNPKFQRFQVPKDVEIIQGAKLPAQGDPQNAELQDAKETAIATVVNGKKTIINVETKPVLPLLDLSLLEPLTFANPLVPQVQHFLPRINQATYVKLPQPEITENKNYQKEFVIQKTKSYGSGPQKGKPKKTSPKKKEKRPSPKDDDIHVHHNAPRPPTVTITGNPEGSPEISYEINSPNYKETYKEKAISYNKETNSEPVSYSYGSKDAPKPVSYSYSHSSKQPAQIKQTHYQSIDGGPKQLVYHFDSEEQRDLNGEEKEDLQERPPPAKHSSAESHNDSSENNSAEDQRELDEAPQQNSKHLQAEHREREEYHPPPKEQYKKEQHDRPQQYHSEPKQHHPEPKQYHPESQQYHSEPKQHHPEPKQYHPESKQYHNEPKQYHPEPEQHHPQPKQYHPEPKQYHPEPKQYHPESKQYHSEPKQYHREPQQYHPEPHPAVQNNEQFHPVAHYEEDIQLIQPEKVGNIKVDPGQHVQQQPPQSQNHSPQPPQNYEDDQPSHHERPQHIVPQHIHEKSRKVIIQEETPEEMHSIHEQMKAEMIGHEENNEEDFEKAYKDAAIGFPAYERHSENVEKEIYNPALYGAPRENTFDVEHTPFQQYQDEGDEFPKATRGNYKDARDKTKEDYYLDYSVSRPESLTDRYKNKVDYYKLYKKQTPERYTVYDDDKEENKKSAKYTAAPYIFESEDQKPKQTFAKYKSQPVAYEYDYSKSAPRDNSAFASHPYRSYKTKTLFVEPQFQYGFEPLAVPQLLDSELAAMASIIRPESEKPGMRKKIYQENFYIKKTSTSAGEPTS